MPTKLFISLEASKYRQELAKVVADTRRAANLMSAAADSQHVVKFTADTRPAEQALQNLPKPQDQEYTVSGRVNAPDVPAAADQVYQVRGIAFSPVIPDVPDQSYQVVGNVIPPEIPAAGDQEYMIIGTVEAPEMPKPQDQQYQIIGSVSAPEIPEAQDQSYTIMGELIAPDIPQPDNMTYTVTGSVSALEIPEAQDQAYTVTGSVNAPEIPQAEDQEYTITGQLNVPDVPQAQDQQFTVSADIAPAERALSDLSDLSDLSYTVTGSVNAPEIPQAEDQEYTITGSVNAPEIPVAADQAYTITGQLKAPKVPKLPDQEIQVTANTKPAEQSMENLDTKSASAAKTMNKGFRAVWQEITKLDGGAKRLVATMLAGGGLIGIVMAGVQSVVKLCTMALDAMSVKGKEAAETYRQYADSIAEAAANNERLKQSSNEALTQLAAMANAAKLSNAEQEKAVSLIAALTRQYGDLGVSVDKATGKIKGLGTAIVEKETRDTQRQIRSIEAQLKERRNARDQEDQNISKAGYNLGKINKAVNWLSPIGIIKNLFGWTDKENEALGLDKTQFGGEQDAKEAAERRAKDDKEIQELELKRQAAKKKLAEIAKKQLEQTLIQNAALEEEKKEREKQAKYRSADNELGRMKYAEDKIANRQTLIDSEKKDNDALRSRTAAAKADMDRYAHGAKEADPQKFADAQRVYLQNAAEQAKSDERIANWQNQIKQLQYEQAEAKKRILEQSAFELEYNRLILAGEFDKAAALKQEYELKQQNLKLSDKNKQSLLDQRKAMERLSAQKMISEIKEQVRLNQLLLNGQYAEYEAEKLRIEQKKQAKQFTEAETKAIVEQTEILKRQSLQKSQRDQALDLKWRAMEAAGKGKEASEQRALWDAERTKGRKLTDSEIAATKKLHELTWNFDNQRKQDFSAMAVQTNSLTARGGFQTGAAAPDTDKYNRIIADNGKTMLSVVQRIESLCSRFGNF